MPKIYCHGEEAYSKVIGQWWHCGRCGKRLWKNRMPRKRVIPTVDEVKIVYVWNGPLGFRYTARGWDDKVIYDSPTAFRNRRKAREEIWRYWPGVRVSFETI